MKRNVAVIGLGKVGASMLAAFASRGFSVIGVDLDQRTVDLLNRGLAPVQETGLAATLSEHKDRFRATTSFREAILESQTSFVIVPTPSSESGAFSLHCVAEAFEQIGAALADRQTYHTVVLTSTVLPGATRYGLVPILERTSGRRAGSDFGVCYSPEFIALGSVLEDLLNPDFTLIGEIDEKAGKGLEDLYSLLVLNDAPCRRMSLENAELTKIAVNSFITMKISFANMIGEMCEELPGGDVDVVTQAIGSDARIGTRYLKGAIGYGGPCFPRDTVALEYLAGVLEQDAPLVSATAAFNQAFFDRTLRRLLGRIEPTMTAAVLGLAYKPRSSVVTESPGVRLANGLCRAGVTVVGYDPLAAVPAKAGLVDGVEVLSSVAECLERADAVLITTPDEQFERLGIDDFPDRPNRVLVVDFWRVLGEEVRTNQRLEYTGFGIGNGQGKTTERLLDVWGEAANPGANVR